jgi:hypothetical protein
MAVNITRTMNPLPFQDLEPKRFEDLVRQLTYEFRPWRRLEATGRSGSDDGFDARALEIVDLSSEWEPSGDEADGEDTSAVLADRLWLVQCKRERAIGPAKAASYLDEIVLSSAEPLYGLIFAAACDFSKKTRDTIFDWCRKKGIAEAHVWGRGELEDMLFQPKNDNLLFAYFGISLAIRRRSQASQLRTELATKRKLKKMVMTSSAEILVRDPSAVDYPDVKQGKRPTQWWVYAPEELTHYGLMVSVRWHYAYIDPATGEWDAADAVSSMERYHPWHVADPKKELLDGAARKTWDALPQQNRGWLKVSGFIPLRNIVAIDEIGDDIFEGAHLYVPFHSTQGPFDGGGFAVRLSTTSQFGGDFEAKPEKRIVKFSNELRRLD